jgi:uncharacterized protein (DUF58 family)
VTAGGGDGHRRRPVPVTRTGLGVVVAGAACYALGLTLGYPPLIVVAAGCLLALAGAAATVLWRPQLEVERSFQPAAVTVGQAAVALVTVRNRSRWPSPPVTVVDQLADDEVVLRVRSVPGGATARVRYELPTQRRARLVLGPLRVVRADPLGLLEVRQDHGGRDVLWVRPRTHPLSALPASAVVDLEGPVSETAPPGSLTFSSLREYAPGDDRRLIHWRSSARLGTLMVRHHVDTNEPSATVVLDNRRGPWSAASFEHGVEVAASVVQALLRGGDRVALRTVREPPTWARDLGATTLLDRLAAVPHLDVGDPTALLDAVRAGAEGGALVVVTGQLEPALEARLAAERHRFAPIVVCRVELEGRAGWRQRSGLAVAHGTTAAALADAWDRMARR